MFKITLGVEGMMCNMCEAHVNEAVRNAFPVKKVTSSHKEAETVIISEEEIPEEKLAAVINETGYKVTGYKSEPYVKKGLFGR
ncbi:MAG: heavy-metal-associated domain-containing protein [Lachnospiraceae bacterium]|nr:heavy-metal-associated domain-containing protein [Lachnospiraceae bacterium]